MMTTKIRSSVRRARKTASRRRGRAFAKSRVGLCAFRPREVRRPAPRSDRTVDVVAAAASRHVLARLDEANLCPVDDDIALAVRLYHASIGDFERFAAPSSLDSASTSTLPRSTSSPPRPRVRTRRRSRRRFRPRRVRRRPERARD